MENDNSHVICSHNSESRLKDVVVASDDSRSCVLDGNPGDICLSSGSSEKNTYFTPIENVFEYRESEYIDGPSCMLVLF